MKKLKLTVELVPVSNWGLDLPGVLTKARWKQITDSVRAGANWSCEICGAKPERRYLSTHEQWQYDYQTRTQSLVGMISLCGSCHGIKHIGRSRNVLKTEQFESLIAHFMKVNRCDRKMFDEHELESLKEWAANKQTSFWDIDYGTYNDIVNWNVVKTKHQEFREEEAAYIKAQESKRNRRRAVEMQYVHLAIELKERYADKRSVLVDNKTNEPIKKSTLLRRVGGKGVLNGLFHLNLVVEKKRAGVTTFVINLDQIKTMQSRS